MEREIELHSQLNHPHIVKLYGSKKLDGKLFIILEYLPNGTLFDRIQKTNMTNEEIIDIFIDLMDAVAYIHSKNMIHRDIKPENIIAGEDDKFKICDFGFTALVGNIRGKNHKRMTFCGTNEYFAPEILNGQQQSEKVDIWTMGVLLYEVAHKRSPFKTETYARLKTITPSLLIK